MSAFFQKPKVQFIEIPATGPPYMLRVLVGERIVGHAEMEMCEGGNWGALVRYYDHADQYDDEEAGFDGYDEAREWVEGWFRERWDVTWLALCGEPMEQATVSLTLNPLLIMQTDDSVSCGSPDNVIGSVVRAKGRYLCLYEYAGEEIFATKKTAIEVPVWFEEVHSEMLVKLMTKNVIAFDMTTGETP